MSTSAGKQAVMDKRTCLQISFRRKKTVAACLVLCTGMFAQPMANGGPFDDWVNTQIRRAFDDVTTQDASAWNVQGSMGISGGGMRVRSKNVAFPFQIGYEMPSVSIGCGGIDWHGGALGLIGVDGMNFQQIGQKLIDYTKSVASNAVKLSIKMAIGALSEKLAHNLDVVEDYANQLNKLSMDSCAAGQEVASFLEKSLTKGAQDSRQKASIAGTTASPPAVGTAGIEAKQESQVNFAFKDGNWTWQLIHSHDIKPANASTNTEKTLSDSEIRIAHSLLGSRLNITACDTQDTPTVRREVTSWDCTSAMNHPKLSAGVAPEGGTAGNGYKFGTVPPTITGIPMLLNGSPDSPHAASMSVYPGGPEIKYHAIGLLRCPDDSTYDDRKRCIAPAPGGFIAGLMDSDQTHYPLNQRGSAPPLSVTAEKNLRLLVAGLQNTLPGNRAWTPAEKAELISFTKRIRTLPVYRYLAVMTALQPLAAESMVDQIKGVVAVDMADYVLVSLEKMTINAYVMAASGTAGSNDLQYLDQVKQRLKELRAQLSEERQKEVAKHGNLLDIDQRLRTMEGALLSTMPGGLAGNLGFARQFIGG